MKNILLLTFILIVQITLCQQTYLDELPPDTIPRIFGKGKISIDNRNENSIAFSPDGNQILFSAGKKIHVIDRVNGKWTKSKLAPFVANDIVSYYVRYSPDGRYIGYIKGDYPQKDHGDLYVIEKTENGWSKEKRLPSPINSYRHEGGFSFLNDNSFYYTSCIDTTKHKGASDVYYSSFENNCKKDFRIVNELNSFHDEEGIFVAPNEKYAIIQCWKDHVAGKHNFYIAYKKAGDDWTTPILVDSLINGSDHDGSPFVSYDEKYLFFNSRRGDYPNEEAKRKGCDIYWVSTKKLFKPYVNNSVPDFHLRMNQYVEFKIPENSYKDYDGHKITFQANVKDGGVLPKWLNFDADNLLFSGTPTKKETINVVMTIRDENNNKIMDVFKIIVE